jgi:hypothetical protein
MYCYHLAASLEQLLLLVLFELVQQFVALVEHLFYLVLHHLQPILLHDLLQLLQLLRSVGPLSAQLLATVTHVLLGLLHQLLTHLLPLRYLRQN